MKSIQKALAGLLIPILVSAGCSHSGSSCTRQVMLPSTSSEETQGWASEIRWDEAEGSEPAIRLVTREGTARKTVTLVIEERCTDRVVNSGGGIGHVSGEGAIVLVLLLPVIILTAAVVVGVNSSWAGEHWTDLDGEGIDFEELERRYEESGFDLTELRTFHYGHPEPKEQR